MSTEQTTTGTALLGAPQPPRSSRPTFTSVDNPMGIMDTARFEHLGRVAMVMARAGLLPETLTHTGPEGRREPLPFEVVQARAYLIANQADLWHADPMAVAQCTSLVYNRLMYEGKLVHGIIAARLGVDLKYEFGVYNARKRDIDPLPENGLAPDDQSLGVRVSGTLPGETEPRWIAGSVAMWHKGAKSPWGNPTAWPRQLRYMGAREWGRAYKPSLLLGIITEDEVDEYQMAREVGAVAPAGPAMLHGGFEERREPQVIEGPKRTRAKRAAPADPLDGDDIPAEGGARPTGTDGAQGADTQPGTSASATDASPASQGQPDSSPPASSEPTSAGEPLPEDEQPDVLTEGYPAPGEVYHLDGDTWGEDGRRETYKDGLPFSSSTRKPGNRIYADHAPAAAEDTAGASDAQDEGEADDLPPEFTVYIGAVEKAETWADVKVAMSTFYKTDLFKGLPPEQQNKIRADTWDAITEKGLKDLPDQAADVSAYRLWIEHQEDADAISGTLRILEQEPTFKDKPDDFKKVIRDATATRLGVLGA